LSKNKKISVGFLSSDFTNHATAHLILGFFNSYNKEKFEFFTYSHSQDNKSSYRKFIEKATKFKDISNLSNLEALT
jgi:predicted O-linked N-acetylglucosamine transferase (SPINDLY family)